MSGSAASNSYGGEMTKLFTIAIAALALALVPGVASADGFTQDKLDDHGWLCGAEAELPAGHCMNPGTGHGPGNPGTTFQLMVFDEGGHFHSAEVASVHPKAGDRPCPHDDEALDGTWWNPEGTPLQVCHHR
jgi:hypothetical protein